MSKPLKGTIDSVTRISNLILKQNIKDFLFYSNGCIDGKYWPEGIFVTQQIFRWRCHGCFIAARNNDTLRFKLTHYNYQLTIYSYWCQTNFNTLCH
jgi:hypothetical protein